MGQSKSPQQRAALRVCASCEWVFKASGDCPQCGFGSYGARYVYGNKAYRYHFTQKPWFDKQMGKKADELHKFIMEHPETIRTTPIERAIMSLTVNKPEEKKPLNFNGDNRPAKGSWAPGNYYCKCNQCEQEYIGDKRSWSCADCEYKQEE